MGGGGGSSTSFLARSTTLQSFPLPLNPPPPSPSPHLNPLERSSLPTSVPLPTQTCFRIILELENALSTDRKWAVTKTILTDICPASSECWRVTGMTPGRRNAPRQHAFCPRSLVVSGYERENLPTVFMSETGSDAWHL